MPMIDADGCLLNVSVEGRDGGPTLMLSNSLGSTLQMWEPQMEALTQIFRVIRYDRRGHGKSNVPPGPYSMERFGRDVLAILDDLNIAKTHWCGLSMGGMVGQWLGANAPERFGKIILANTACHYPDPTNWLNRIKAVKEGGIAAVADTVIAGWLTADFREREPQITANMKAMLSASPVAGYLACCEALSTLYAWGDIWTRPHFDHRTRRVLVIGTLIALGQWDEFRLHVRAALAEGGFSADDIKEIILQQAIYCGVPAANHAVKEALSIIAELGLLKGKPA